MDHPYITEAISAFRVAWGRSSKVHTWIAVPLRKHCNSSMLQEMREG